ncbi:MAG: 2-isopropylmalate synthase [Nitrososphaerota archaeon]|nr:2-isopropylmalate synthase [Nitrososphaerota archaeon]MDG6921800.1 2-isopropylmalate synthase [Nitrososphaerota archaeon]
MSSEKGRRIRVLDTTLRDGEQTPGVSLTIEEKVEIARALDVLGVDVIEAGFPIVSDGEYAAVKAIGKLGLTSTVAALSRVDKPDIDALISCDIKYGHLFIATSDLHLKYKLNVTREQALEKAVSGIEYAKAHGIKVEFSAEDSTRTDREYLGQVLRAVGNLGIERIDLPDTVGTSTPERYADLVRFARSQVKTPLSTHCHDDYGLAVANSLAGIASGCDQSHVTINGLGERAGNASLEEFVMAVQRLYDCKTGINTKLLFSTSRLVTKATGVFVQPNKAIVGENAFGHESGIHTHGVLNLPATYEPMEPELVGATRKIHAGKHSGSHGVAFELKTLGIEPTKEELKKILHKVKVIGDTGRTVTDVELDRIARDVIGLERGNPFLKIKDLAVITGVNTVPTASVRLSVGDDQTMTVAETGTGPVDAVLRAIQKVTDKFTKVKLKEYKLEAITGGTNADAEVLVKIEDEHGNISTASSTGSDIVMTSVDAMISGINEVMLRKSRVSPKPEIPTP